VNGPRILVFAYSDVGHACLKFLIERREIIVGLYTHRDNPHENIWFPSTEQLARAHQVPVFFADDLTTADEQKQLSALKPDLIFSFYYRNMIPEAVLSLPTLGAYNMHGSLLPKYRGRAPINWAVLRGEKQAGVTLHVMVKQADAGDIIDQQAVPIGPNDLSAEVQARATHAAVEVLARQIDSLKKGTAARRPQDSGEATYFGKRTPEDGRIDWSESAQHIHNLVRAVSKPYPGAFFERDGKKTIVWRTRVTGNRASSGVFGEVRQENNSRYVTCGDGHELEILEWE
jgi:methionyl-tRNA formyltransferase